MSIANSPRIAPVEPPYETDIAEAFTRIMPEGMAPLTLFRTMANSPRVLQRMFAGALLDPGTVDLRDREIVILRTCFRCGSEYEWGVHVALFSKRAALSGAEVEATKNRAPEVPCLDARERILMQMVDELHDDATVSDAVWGNLCEYYSSEQILELIALVGYYHTISFITNAARVPLEDFAPRFAGEASDKSSS